MEEPLKARLIGAAVLVAIAVLLIPELLSGRKAAEPVAEEGAGPRGTRTFTIELGQGPGQATRSAAAAPAPAPAPTPAPAAAGGPPAAGDTTAAPPIEVPTEPTTGAPGQEPVEPPAPSPEPARAAGMPATTPATVETPPATAAASVEPKPPPALAVPGSGWAVQVGAFGSGETARKLVKDLAGAGYRAFVSPVTKGGKTLYRVRVGPEADKGGAEQLVPRLKARGLPATVVQND